MDNLIESKDLYMSPNLYQKIEKKDKKIKFDERKNDIFSLGMTILELGLNETF